MTAKLEHLWQFYVIFVLGRIVSANAVAGIVPKTAIVNWFRRFRGRALGFISMASPLGSSMLVFIAQLIIERHGWRSIFSVIYGLTLRGEGTLFNIILAQYYGRGSFGSINGFVLLFHMLGLGFGPMISSISFDLTGSYHAVFSVYVVVSIITALSLLCAKKPIPPAC